MSKITNLIGTTWRLDYNKLYGITAGYSIFNIDGSWHVDAGGEIVIGPNEFAGLAIGYYGQGMVNVNDLNATANAIAFGSPVSQNGNIVAVLYYSLEIVDVTGPFISLTITGGEDISNPLFIDFINTYGTLVSGGEPSNKVEYNGAVIASLEAGQTATVQCANKKAASDITITFVSAGTITYDGVETAVEAGKTATFKCAGKKMLSDITVVIAEVEEEPTIIKLETPVIEFVIEGEETDEPQLTAPTVELDGTTLNIYDDEGIATSYDILVDGVVMDTVGVGAGDEETPIEDELVGTWVINSNPNNMNWSSGDYIVVEGTYNYDNNIGGMKVKSLNRLGAVRSTSSSGYNAFGVTDGTSINVYLSDGSVKCVYYESYSGGIHKPDGNEETLMKVRTITITACDTTQTNYQYWFEWLKANATKQVTKLISFTIDGTTYQAEEGMTYADWIDSEYNTGGFYTSGTFLLGADGAQYGIGPNMTISNVIEDGDALFMTSGGAM